jgi:hypothetical protein
MPRRVDESGDFIDAVGIEPTPDIERPHALRVPSGAWESRGHQPDVRRK